MYLFQSLPRKWLFFILLVVTWDKIEIKQLLFWPFVWGLQVLMAWIKPRFIQVCAVLCLFAQSCPTLCDPMEFSLPGSSVHGHFPGKKNRMSCHALLPGVFPTQGWNPGLPHCRQILYHLSQQGSPRVLERVVYPFSRATSQPSNQTGVSCIAGGFFTHLSQQGSPRMLERVIYPFSRATSQNRNQTGVSCTAGGFFTNWDTWEVIQAYSVLKQMSSRFSKNQLLN